MAGEFRRRMIWKFGLIFALTAGSVVAVALRGIRRGLDLSGGTELQYVIRGTGLSGQEKRELTDRTTEVIRRRVDPQGTLEPDIRVVGTFRFAIRLPHMTLDEAKVVEERVQRSGRLLFCLASDNQSDCAKASAGNMVPNYTPFVAFKQKEPKSGRIVRRFRKADFRDLPALKLRPSDWMGLGGDAAVLVKSTPEITGDLLDTGSVHVTRDARGGVAIGFAFQGKGRREFTYITERNKGRQLAIILDEILYSAPVIQSRISGPGIIENPQGFDPDEARDLSITLQSGSLPADIDLEWKHGIGPELGEDSVRAGVKAALIGLIVVVLVMSGYYLASGLISVLALVLNAVLILGVMALFGTTMTLPGIAGLILTLGMAVDANVLICERIREEKATGKAIRLAVKNGYDRAFVTIIDSNLTTLITGIILYFVGTGPVKGFAIVLSIGILVSIFTSVFVTRAVTELLIEANVLRRLSMVQLFRRTQIRFSRIRYIFMAASAALIIAGLVVFVQRGEKKYDSDLLGGFMAEMELQRPMSTDEFRSRVVKAGYPRASIQSLWVSGVSGEGNATLFSIRVRKLDEATATAKIQEDVRRQLEGAALLKAMTPIEPWTYRISLAAPMTEMELRAQLKLARYEMADIADIFSDQARDNQFTLYVGGKDLSQAELAAAVDEVEKVLEKTVATRLRQYSAGPVEQKRETAAAELWTLTLTFNESVPRQALEDTFKRTVSGAGKDKQFRVVGTGRDEGAEVCLHVRIEASDRKILDEILAAHPDKTLSIPSLVHASPNVLEIETKEPLTEPALRERLGTGAGKIQAIIPKEAKAEGFVLRMNAELKDEKVTEKIKEDLEREFQGELAQKKLDVAFAPLENVQDLVKHPEDLISKGYSFLEMTIKEPGKDTPHAVTMQVVADNLRRAGYPDALLVEGFLRGQAEQAASAVPLKFKPSETPREKYEADIRSTFTVPEPFRRVETVGARVSGEMKNAAFWATVLSLLAMLVYIWVRFGELRFGVGAVVALAHDVLITMGAVAVADALSETTLGVKLGFSELKINLVMIGAFLTLVGYSVNDTIVVFDRIRENMGGRRGRLDAQAVDNSINQTLSRTVLTSVLTLIVVLCLYFLGGPVVHGFGFVLSFGIIVGTYSSIFIASPILVDWHAIVAFVRRVLGIATFRFLRSTRRA